MTVTVVVANIESSRSIVVREGWAERTIPPNQVKVFIVPSGHTLHVTEAHPDDTPAKEA